MVNSIISDAVKGNKGRGVSVNKSTFEVINTNQDVVRTTSSALNLILYHFFPEDQLGGRLLTT